MILQYAKRYRVRHQRKGTFDAIVLADSPATAEWVDVRIVSGEALSVKTRTPIAVRGDRVTLRRSLCTFEEITDGDTGNV
jgi:hypothetical protein